LPDRWAIGKKDPIKTWFNRTETHRRLVGVFSLGAVPGAAAGTLLLAATPTEDTLARIIGGCLLALVLWRRFHTAAMHMPDPVFVAMSAASGAGSGLLGSVGPLVAEFFGAWPRALRGAYIGTDDAANLLMHITKLARLWRRGRADPHHRPHRAGAGSGQPRRVLDREADR